MSIQAALPGAFSYALSVTRFSGKQSPTSPWFIDFAAFDHMFSEKHIFLNMKPVSSNKSIIAAHEENLPIEGIGTLDLKNKYHT